MLAIYRQRWGAWALTGTVANNGSVRLPLGTRNRDTAIVLLSKVESALEQGRQSDLWSQLSTLVPANTFADLYSQATSNPTAKPASVVPALTWEGLKQMYSVHAQQKIARGRLRRTGLRAGDATDLRWGEIDWVEKGINRFTHKRSKRVWVPVHSELLDALRSEFERRQPSPNDHVLLSPASGKPLDRKSLYERIVRLGNRAGVERAHPHRFRDTFAVDMLLKGASTYQVAKLLGDTVRVVELYYAPYVKELREHGRSLIENDSGLERVPPQQAVGKAA